MRDQQLPPPVPPLPTTKCLCQWKRIEQHATEGRTMASQLAGGCSCYIVLAAVLAASSCVIKGVLQYRGHLSGSCFLMQELQPIPVLSCYDWTLCCVFSEASVYVQKHCNCCSVLLMVAGMPEAAYFLHLSCRCSSITLADLPAVVLPQSWGLWERGPGLALSSYFLTLPLSSAGHEACFVGFAHHYNTPKPALGCISPHRGHWAAGKLRWQRPGAKQEHLSLPGAEAKAEQVTETCNFPPISCNFHTAENTQQAGISAFVPTRHAGEQFSTQPGTSGSWAALRIALFALLWLQVRI